MSRFVKFNNLRICACVYFVYNLKYIILYNIDLIYVYIFRVTINYNVKAPRKFPYNFLFLVTQKYNEKNFFNKLPQFALYEKISGETLDCFSGALVLEE